jgi:hypothetical protein
MGSIKRKGDIPNVRMGLPKTTCAFVMWTMKAPSWQTRENMCC